MARESRCSPPIDTVALAGEGSRGAVVRKVLAYGLPPLFAFALARILLLVAGNVVGVNALDAAAWVHWDAGHYLAIATKGYELVPCAAIGYKPSGWCGNVGWLPGYPYLVAPLIRLGVPGATAGAITSSVCALAALTILWMALLGAKLTVRSGACLGIAALFPGGVYQHAVFPVSLFLALVLGCAALLHERRTVAGAICGSLAAFTYSTGFLLAPVVTLWVLLTGRDSLMKRVGTALAAGVAVGAGFVAVLLLHQIEVGAWDAFFLVQSRYGHGLSNPFHTLAELFTPLALPASVRTTAPPLQTLLVATMMVVASVTVWVRARHLDRLEVFASLYCLAFWLFPLAMGQGVSFYRTESLLVPIVLILRRVPTALTIGLFTLCAALFVLMGTLFFADALV
jgi:hypothetical protein